MPEVWDLVPDADTTLSNEQKSLALVAWFAALVKRLNLPDNLEALGVPREDIPALSDAALNVKRLMNNAPLHRRSRTGAGHLSDVVLTVCRPG